jgi:hypothetical protein
MYSDFLFSTLGVSSFSNPLRFQVPFLNHVDPFLSCFVQQTLYLSYSTHFISQQNINDLFSLIFANNLYFFYRCNFTLHGIFNTILLLILSNIHPNPTWSNYSFSLFAQLSDFELFICHS